MPNTGPKVLNELVELKLSSRSIRGMEQLEVSRSKTEIRRSSFEKRAAIIWNTLTRNVKTIRSYPAFNRELRNSLRFKVLYRLNNHQLLKHKQ